MADIAQEITPEQKEVAKKLLGELNSSSFDAVFTAQEVVSAIKMFVERGEKAEDLLMRADFADDEQATAATRHAAKCADFHDKIGLEELHSTIAARVSIGGKRIDILLKGVTGGQTAPAKKNGMGDWAKRKAGIE
jgi:hypothetical protein